MKKKIKLDKIEAFIFDFDGVLTNNKVYLDQNGIESVICSREDGMAFGILKKVKSNIFILSTERNKIVKSRAKKLGITAVNGSKNKQKDLMKISKMNNFNLENTMYIGNDLNDYFAMKLCGIRVCPKDSNFKIKKISQVILKKNGGDGVVREILEDILKVDILKYMK